MSYKGPFTVNFNAFEPVNSVSDIYANSRMPSAVRIVIKVYDSDDQLFPATTEWLQKNVRLVDYHDTSKLIPGSSLEYILYPSNWFTSPTKGEWDQAGERISSNQVGDSHTLDEYLILYAHASSPETRKFAARVMDPDSKFHYSNIGSDKKGVEIKAIRQISYTTSDLRIEEVKIATQEPLPPLGKWDQTNTYISNDRPNGHPFVKVIPENTRSATTSQPGWEWCWMHRDGSSKYSVSTRHWYTFPMDTKRQTVGTISPFLFGETETVDINVNQRPNAVCITLFETEPQELMRSIPGWINTDTFFRVYDVYGNVGSFGLDTKDDRMKLVVKDHALSAGTDSIEATESSELWAQDIPADVQSKLLELGPQELAKQLSPDHPAIKVLQARFLKYKDLF